MLHITVDPEMAARLSASTLASLEKLQLPALPASYSIMFAYHAGQFPELTREVQGMLGNPASATLARCESLYDRFFGAENILSDCNEAIAGLGQGVAEIGDLLTQTAHHAERFGAIGRDLSAACRTSIEPLRTSLERAATELSDLAQENARLRAAVGERIEASSRSVARVRQRFEAERTVSRTDPLTRIGNRRRLDEEMARQVDASLILADIDHFKRFNDSYGHKAGDLILVAFARILRQVTGERGLAARFGGEEFAIFLPGCPTAEAARLADQARLMLERMAKITTKNGVSLSKVTASFGVATRQGDDQAEGLVERADQALYRAKNGGRNRVVIA
jgi:diguanylate cyclase